MRTLHWQGCLALCMALLTLAAACSGGGPSVPKSAPETPEARPSPEAGLPANVGYLRSSHPWGSQLTVFNADTFEVYRAVEVPPAGIDYSHRLEFGPAGRIWLGYSQIGVDDVTVTLEDGKLHMTKTEAGGKDRVLVFSPEGELEHELDIGCSPPDTGIAFAEGYAFIACASWGFSGQVVVMDTATLEVVKVFDKVHPPGEDIFQIPFYITAMEEVAGQILVIGDGSPPEGYQRLTNYAAAYTRVGVIDPETLTMRGYLTGLEPGLRVLNVLEVDGMAWLFNVFSHLEERPPRTDVYVMAPRSMEIVDQFNLEHPFPVWAEYGDAGIIFIYHNARNGKIHGVQHPTGITRLDLETRQELFTATPEVNDAFGMGVYRNKPCLVHEGGHDLGGLWCMNSDGILERSLPQRHAVGVQFKEENNQGEPASR